jgi:hypothetical protein
MRGSLKGNENENRCPKTGYVDAGAPEKAPYVASNPVNGVAAVVGAVAC